MLACNMSHKYHAKITDISLSLELVVADLMQTLPHHVKLLAISMHQEAYLSRVAKSRRLIQSMQAVSCYIRCSNCHCCVVDIRSVTLYK